MWTGSPNEEIILLSNSSILTIEKSRFCLFLAQGLTIDIGNEVREQNSLLDTMGDGFQSTRDMLQGSLARIGIMLDTSSGKHMCYMVLFVVFVVIFLYWMMTFKGQSGA
jgi:hypothetical protein